MCFFFFFKQKTAYEMRISDWSSDVCSSDLPMRPDRAVVQFILILLFNVDIHKYSIRILSYDGDLERANSAISIRSNDCAPAAQIGRASCRERVCQYV